MIKLRNRIPGVVVFIFFISSLTTANAEVVFQARVANLGIGNSSYGDGKSPDEMVEMVLPGELFNPPKTISTREKDSSGRSTLEGAFAEDIAAMRSDDVDHILSNWFPSERQELKKFLTDKEIRRRNNEWLRKHPNLQISGLVKYKGMGLVLVNNDRLVFTFKKQNNEWFRTNSLSGDDGFDLIFAAWKDGGKVFQTK